MTNTDWKKSFDKIFTYMNNDVEEFYTGTRPWEVKKYIQKKLDERTKEVIEPIFYGLNNLRARLFSRFIDHDQRAEIDEVLNNFYAESAKKYGIEE